MGRKGGREGGRAYLALEVDDLLDLLIRETTFGRDELLALLGVGVKEAGGDLPREGGREGGRGGLGGLDEERKENRASKCESEDKVTKARK